MLGAMAGLAILAGILQSIQGPVNSNLGTRTDTFQATMISFGGGTLVLALLVLIMGQGDLGLLVQAQPWQVIGGLYGIINVCVSVAAMPVLGVAVTLTTWMFGQLIMAAVIDGFGLLDTTAVAISPLRILGIAAVAIGIVLFCLSNLQRQQKAGEKHAGAGKSRSMIFIILSFATGLLGAMQAPTNASLATVLGGKLEAALVSFAGGFLAISIITLVRGKGRLKPVRGVGIRFWMFTGGIYGAANVFIGLYTVPILGAALQMACFTVGQLASSMVIDSYGLIWTKKIKVNRFRLFAVAAIALGVALVTAAKMQV